MESAARVSGSRFAYLKGDLAFIELALVQYALRKTADHGFTPVIPPVLVREEPMFWTGFLPTDRAQIYEIARDDLYLVGTSEVSLAGLHPDQILSAPDLPLRYAGFSTCFRREAGAAGKDTRGIFRVHQFDKVEMFTFVAPRPPRDEHERLLAIEEEILQELEIPYRVVNVAVGDLGASAAKKYDCEAWLPGQGRYRELTSTSNTTDYQARRLRCRFRPGGRVAAARPHAQRHGRRRGPHIGGDHGEPPAGRRRIPCAGRAAIVWCTWRGFRLPVTARAPCRDETAGSNQRICLRTPAFRADNEPA